jgi:hypothetical protein
VLAGGGVTVVLPVLLALGLTADQANATSRFNLTVGTLIVTGWPAERPYRVAPRCQGANSSSP